MKFVVQMSMDNGRTWQNCSRGYDFVVEAVPIQWDINQECIGRSIKTRVTKEPESSYPVSEIENRLAESWRKLALKLA